MSVSSSPAIPIRVLHVDDELTQLRVLKSYLEVFDPSISIKSTASPEEALRLLQQESFDCVISDYQMKEMNGIEFARRVQGVSEIPFILYTGRGSEEVASNAFAAGVNDYIRKESVPSNYEVLANRIKAVVEKKRAENAMLDSEEKYRSLFVNMLEGYAYCKIILDETDRPVDFIYLEINDAFETLTGLRRENVVGKKATEAIPGIKEAHPELFEIYGRVAISGKAERFDLFFEPLERWLSISVYSPRKSNFIAVFDNITERKQMEVALREGEERYRSLVEDSRDGVMVFTGSELVYANQQAASLHGFSSVEEMMKGRPRSWLHPEDREWIEEKNLARQRGEDVQPISEFRLVLPDGAVRTVQSSSSKIEYAGKTSTLAFLRDITERKQMEEALKASEVKYRSLLEEGLDGVVVTWNGEYHYVNQRYADMLGYADPSELLGRNTREVVDPRDAEHLDAIREQRQRGGIQRLIYKIRSLKKDGSSIWMEVASSGIEFEGNQAVITYARDISERKQMEEGLKQSEEKYRGFLEASRDAVFVLDQSKYLYANQTAAKLLGFNDSSELIGRDAFEFIVPEDREKVRELTARRQRGEDAPSLYEFSLVNKEGSKIPVEANVSLIEFEGKPASLAMNRDITKRKRMEEEVRWSEERWRSLVELAPEGIMTVNLKGEITWVNEGFLRLTGFAREEIIGKPFSKLNTIQARDIPKYLKMFAQALRGNMPTLVEYSYIHRDGSIRWGEGHFTIINVGGKREVLGYLMDVTKHKALEARLRDHSEMLESLVEEKVGELIDAERFVTAGRVAAMVVHDLRNPISAIKNALFIMDKAPDKAGEAREIINDAVDRTLRMLEDLRYRTRDTPLSLLTVDLGDLLVKTVEEYPFPDTVAVVTDLGEGLDEAMLDPYMIRRILDNLIGNAVDAMPLRGTLTVKAELAGDEIHLSVSDTGAGIPEEERGDLFKPFHTTKPSGMGLGLAYCKRAVEAHGGSITFESRMGEGSTFRFNVPLKKENEGS